jgi:hypothetical protein
MTRLYRCNKKHRITIFNGNERDAKGSVLDAEATHDRNGGGS